MTYSATAALPYVDSVRAVVGLRGQLRRLAGDGGTVPDWSTLRVVGPDEVVGRHGVVWYEWTATVESPAARSPHPEFGSNMS